MRIYPVLPARFGFDPALPILETLGVEDPDAATTPADGQGLAEAVVSAAIAQAGPDKEASAAATAPDDGPQVADALSAPDAMAGLVKLVLNSVAEARPSWSAIQGPFDLPSLPSAVFADFGNTAWGAWPIHAGGTTPIETVSSAKGGAPGSGGGSGGGGGGGVLTEYKSGSTNGTSGYDILIQFKGSSWTPALQQAFTQAADYFTTVITADIGGGGRIGRVTVDDLYVTAELATIDGVGGILGQAGPTSVWTASELTAAGQMQFDTADALTYLGKGLWDDIVTHELMHVLGLGSLWNYGANPLVSGYHYTGSNGLAAYRDAKGNPSLSYIPVEDGGGSGTAGAHWDEQALSNELMTGYINDDGNSATVTDNYLSEFSIMSLADLGYQVAYQGYPFDGQLIA